MITLKSCPICESRGIGPYSQIGLAPQVKHEITPGVLLPAAIVTYYFQCQSCHVIFQNPRMSDEELNRFYGEGVYRRTLNLTDEQKNKDEEYRAKIDSEIIRQFIGNVKSHLDVGCSRGLLLEKVGAKTKVGVENDIKGVTVKGVKVYLEIAKVPQKSFDLVTAIQVLEHVPDPLGFLRDLAKKVGDGGYLIVEVPTWKSPGGPLRLAHLYHFEPDVLRLMCREAGLTVIETEFTPHLLLICKLA